MPATYIQLQRPALHQRLALRLRLLWLNYEIASDEQWIEDCRKDGITDSEQIRYQLAAVSNLIVQRAIVLRELGR